MKSFYQCTKEPYLHYATKGVCSGEIYIALFYFLSSDHVRGLWTDEECCLYFSK